LSRSAPGPALIISRRTAILAIRPCALEPDRAPRRGCRGEYEALHFARARLTGLRCSSVRLVGEHPIAKPPPPVFAPAASNATDDERMIRALEFVAERMASTKARLAHLGHLVQQ